MRQLKINYNITNRTITVEKFFNEISKYELLTPEQEADLAYKTRQGDENAAQLLVKHNLRFVVSCAKQYHKRNMELTDLIQAGCLGIIEAAKRFDETKGFKFISYAVWWIRQGINEEIYRSRTIRMPANAVATMNRQTQAVEKSRQQLNIGLSNYVEYADNFPHVARSIDETMGDSLNSETLGDMLPADDVTDTAISRETDRMHLITKIKKILDARCAEIVIRRFGLHGKEAESLEQIGKSMKITRERIRQLTELSLKKLRKKKENLISCLN